MPTSAIHVSRALNKAGIRTTSPAVMASREGVFVRKALGGAVTVTVNLDMEGKAARIADDATEVLRAAGYRVNSGPLHPQLLYVAKV